MKPDDKIMVFELGRGLAAFAVLLHHAALSADAFASGQFGHLFHWGIYGVDFFFVLSGFIILHVHYDDCAQAGAARGFARRRIERIYVPYLPISLGLVALYMLLPGLSHGDRDWGLITSLTLFPTGHQPALSVAWTLTYEMLFYTVFLVFFFTRHFFKLMVVWALAVVVVWAPGAKPFTGDAPLLAIALNPLVLEFMAGMACAVLYRRLSPSTAPALIIAGLFMIVAFFMVGGLHRAFFGLAIAPVVLGLALLEKEGGLKLPQVSALLGASSYAVYLVHNPVQSVAARLLEPLGVWTLTLALCALIGFGAGLIYHLAFERPILSYMSKRRANRRQGAALHSLEPYT